MKLTLEPYDMGKNQDMVLLKDVRGMLFGAVHVDLFHNGEYDSSGGGYIYRELCHGRTVCVTLQEVHE